MVVPLCRNCRQPITQIPGGWTDAEGWDSCADRDTFHEPGDPAPNDEILNHYLTGERP